MTKKYQNEKIDTPTGDDGFVVPERVSVAMTEIAGSMREGLLALAVGTGLQVMQVLMEIDVTALAGPKGKHDRGRTAVRHGSERGSVTLGGRRVPVSRPRVRAADGSGELPVPTYELFAGTEILGSMAMERMLAGLSTRRYPVGLEPVGERVSAAAKSTSKSAVSRKFVAMTETALAELLAADLTAWMQTLALTGHYARRWEPKRLRLRLLTIPARHARTGRRRLLHLAATAPVTALALQALDALARLTGPAAAPAPG